MIKKLFIFDFDGTLVDSPKNTIENRKLWESRRNDEWSYRDTTGAYTKGWWSKPESLDSKVFDIKTVPHVKDRVLEALNIEDSHVCLCTGRIAMFSSICKNILFDNGIPLLHDYHFSDSYSTLEFKLSTFRTLLLNNPFVEYVEIWEDRPTHVEIFRTWGSNQDCEVKVIQVDLGEFIEEDIIKSIEDTKKDYLNLVKDIDEEEKYDLFALLSDTTYSKSELLKLIDEEFNIDKSILTKLFEMRTDIRLFRLIDEKDFDNFVFYH